MSGKLTTSGLFSLKIKIERKRKLDSFLFYGENNSKTFKNYYVIRAESPPLNQTLHLIVLSTFRKSSRPGVFLKKSGLKICCKFTREHACRNVIWKKDIFFKFLNSFYFRRGCNEKLILGIVDSSTLSK